MSGLGTNSTMMSWFHLLDVDTDVGGDNEPKVVFSVVLDDLVHLSQVVSILREAE